jgi:hypothetical protein
MQTSPEYPLRPLTIGEIFDRAVTIYVRNFVVFTLIVLTLLAPLAVVQYFALGSTSQSLAQIAQQTSDSSSKAPATKPPELTNQQVAVFAIVIVLAALFAPFVNNAVALGVARIYGGERPSYGSEFAGVFTRWLPLIGTALVNLMILGGLYGATVFVFVIVVTIGVMLVVHALPIAVALFILAGLCLLAVLPLFLMLLIVYAFSMYATTIERVDPGNAIASAFARVFGRSEIKKSLLMALAYMGLELGVLCISVALGLLLTIVLKLPALQLVISTIVNAMLVAFLAILLAVYYYDVRTRKEGLDLETDLQRLTAV